jgi:hypothetical protein
MLMIWSSRSSDGGLVTDGVSLVREWIHHPHCAV